MGCIACDRIELIKSADNFNFIEELETSYLVLADNQFYQGYCIHLFKEHCEQLSDLSCRTQTQLYSEVARTAAAISLTFSPRRINYACLGNECHHVHWHIVPRYDWDPEPTQVIWTPSNHARKKQVTPEERTATIKSLRRALFQG